MDKLSLDMIECEKAGFGCHYGKWKATQEPVETPKNLPDGWKVCIRCGKWYKPKQKKNNQKYCEPSCQQQAQRARDQEKNAQYMRDYRAKRKGSKNDVD